jgi:hypothetical protein
MKDKKISKRMDFIFMEDRMLTLKKAKKIIKRINERNKNAEVS